MPLSRENDKWEWHNVQCASCSHKCEIKLKLGTLWKSSLFSKTHEYICKLCKKSKRKK